MAEFAPGIPSREIKPLPVVKSPQQWTLAVQRHHAERAGEHLDLRLVDPKGLAHSWAIPQATIPKPGEKAVYVIPQPTHTAEYATTAGKGKEYVIAEGYGKGRVNMEVLSPVEVHHSDPSSPSTKLRFNLYTSKGPQEFAIVETDRGSQILVNKTMHRGRLKHLPLGSEAKPKMRVADPSRIDFDSPDAMMPKYDGAHTLIDLHKAGRTPRIFSYRLPKDRTAGVIEHTHKVPFLAEQRIPDEVAGTVLRAELIGVDQKGRGIPATTLGGMLNATVPRSRELQKEHGAVLMPVPFDVVRYKGKDVSKLPFSERYAMVKAVAKLMGMQPAEIAQTADEKRDMLKSIQSGKHPLTAEGVVLKPWEQHGKPTKLKFRPDHDVYVRDVFPARGQDGKVLDRAGGFTYSHSPSGKIVGRVGTGFDHATARDMLKNPKLYVGRVARVEAEKKFDTGALSKPSFLEWHIEKGKTADVSTPLQPHQQRVVDKIKKQPGLVVAHSMGTGKTLTSLAAAESMGMPTSVVVPASLQSNYKKEMAKHVSEPKAQYNVESLQRIARSGKAPEGRLLVVDEAHRLREPGTKAQAAIRHSGADKRLLLTGTPLYNRPHDLARLVNIAAGDSVFPQSRGEFNQKYIGEKIVKPGFFAKVFKGVKPGSIPELKNKEEMGKALQQWVDFHENTKSPDFPTRRDVNVETQMSPEQKEIYESVMGDAPAWVRYKVKKGLPPSKQESKSINAFLSAARQVSVTPGGFMENSTPGEAAKLSPKIQEAFSRLQQRIAENPQHKALVYSNFLESGIDPYESLLQQHKIPYGKFTGQMARKSRNETIKSYNEGRLRALLVSSAGGEGLDLRGTRQIQVLDPHWNKEKLEQVIARGIRYKSHSDLPEDQRNVDVESYSSVMPEPGKLRKLLGAKRPGGVDEYLRTMSRDKDVLNQQVRALLRGQQ